MISSDLELFISYPDAYCLVSLPPNQRFINNARNLHRQDYRSALMCILGAQNYVVNFPHRYMAKSYIILASNYATKVLVGRSPQD